MKCVAIILLGACAALAQSPIGIAQIPQQVNNSRAAKPPKMFQSAVSQVKEKSRIAVLLPGKLAQPAARARYVTVEEAAADKYSISLYSELGVGDSGFAASFAADAHPAYQIKDLGDVRQVRLSRGLVGYFRPIRCGGSCAPANLWWEENQVLYHMQLKSSEHDIRSSLIQMADSAILAGPR